ncbi:MAG: sodium:solute symporter family protein [Ignavibacteriales bacterium]|nr:sodium:solute symporter family protein [Ignavibacteriales bacterium]
MVSFSQLDLFIIVSFFIILLLIGFLPRKETSGDTSDYLLSGRKVGLFLFIMTNVATWYGGILGVGEFTYRYGLLSWFTQGLPYYIFAIIFALFFAKKIRIASLFTIPDKLEQVYGRKVGLVSAILIFILVSPAPYLLMTANLLSLIFNIKLLPALIISLFVSGIYLLKGGYKSDLYTDVFQFFVMFIGFFLIVFISYSDVGNYHYLKETLPHSYLQLTSNVSPIYVIVWFLIALWTFADPGFHQRCYAAKNGNTAKWGIIISVFFMILFDFLTTTTGLYARATLPNLSNPVLSFPLYAERILGSGTKGIFYAAMFATIISTLNSFIFLSATTFGHDFVFKLRKNSNEKQIPNYTRVGLLFSSIVAVTLAYFVQSVISLWYIIGSICIPGIILVVFGAYYERMRISNGYALVEIIGGAIASLFWFFIREQINIEYLDQIEPMIAGLFFVIIVHSIGMIKQRCVFSSSRIVQ